MTNTTQKQMADEILDILEGVENGKVLVKHAHAAIMRTINSAHLTKPDAGGGEAGMTFMVNPAWEDEILIQFIRSVPEGSIVSVRRNLPPSDVPAEPSVVPMPEPVFKQVGVEQGTNRRVQLAFYGADQLQAYADARVSEATRELVDELAHLRGGIDSIAVDRASLRMAVDRLISKYTQTQKESK